MDGIEDRKCNAGDPTMTSLPKCIVWIARGPDAKLGTTIKAQNLQKHSRHKKLGKASKLRAPHINFEYFE